MSISMVSCEKNIAKNFTGDYEFTTVAWTYCGHDVQVDTILYHGNITENSKKSLRIEYAVPVNDTSSCTGIHVDGIINLDVDADGNLNYPDYSGGDFHRYFTGSIDDSKNVDIQFGYHGLGSGSEQKIRGRKL
jgi:hypothetical protein